MPSKERTVNGANKQQTPAQIAAQIDAFITTHPTAVVAEDGKVLFDLSAAEYSLKTDHGQCLLHLWASDGNIMRRVTAATPRQDSLQLATLRFGQSQPKLLEFMASRQVRTPTARDTTRRRYLNLIQRVLVREFPQWEAKSFRSAMDLERSFGPAYARGSLVRGNQAWAVIGVNQHESQTTVDGILTLGVLWLHHCRETAAGKRLYQGLKVIVPRTMITLTQSRMSWMNPAAAKWELYELEEHTEELSAVDANDVGNLRTRLVHRPSEAAAKERFAPAVDVVMGLVPAGEESRVEQRLRSSTELGFLLHGLEFARAHIAVPSSRFVPSMDVRVGAGENETVLTDANRDDLATFVAELFQRRRAHDKQTDFSKRGLSSSRRIGPSSSRAAHARVGHSCGTSDSRMLHAQQDPLFRAAPERWLESMLRRDLAPLTRGLAADRWKLADSSSETDDDRGNRASDFEIGEDYDASRVIPQLDPHHVYTQVPAIAGASDRGMLDLLGVTADKRLAVIELKADDDLQLAMQGLDYWIRVRHHHLQSADPATGMGEFQRHGYFVGLELSPLPPRLYLVAPALHIHPATETILRYFSPQVDWTLLALDERWRKEIRVVWRKVSQHSTATRNRN